MLGEFPLIEAFQFGLFASLPSLDRVTDGVRVLREFVHFGLVSS